MLFAVVSVSMSAQHYPGRAGGNYIDRSTLEERSKHYSTVINDKSHDVCIWQKDGRKAWFNSVGGMHFVCWYDQAITRSEQKILPQFKKELKEKKKREKEAKRKKK